MSAPPLDQDCRMATSHKPAVNGLIQVPSERFDPFSSPPLIPYANVQR